MIEPYATVDGGSAAFVMLDNVKVGDGALLGNNEDALPLLQAGFDRAIAASCAEMVGIIEVLNAATIDYTKTRVQFGQPLAANQVIRHRIADMSIVCEEARSMALRAALFADNPNPSVRARALASARSKVSQAARFVAEQAVQLHGGMGVTDELNIGAYLKRVLAIDAMFGSAEHHLRRHAALSGRSPQAA